MTARRAVHKNWILFILALAQFVVILDATIVNVALPSMARALEIAPNNLQWIITAYTLAFGGFLLLGGRTADLLGKRNVFVTGVLAFSLGSLLVGISNNETQVIIARGLQGLAGAFMSPAALAIVLSIFKEGAERNKALGVWGGVASSGAAVGLLLGGVLTQYLNWRWNFFVNVPVGILVAIAAWQFVPESKSEADHRVFDVFGAVTVTAGLMMLVYALSKVPANGWTSSKTLWMLGGSFALLAVFVFNEMKVRKPLVPLRIFRVGNISGANLTMLPTVAAMFAMFFFLTLYVQNLLKFDPVETGFAFLPVAIVIGIVAGIASKLVTKIGYKPLMVVGPLFVSAALYWFGQVPVPPMGGFDGADIYFQHVLPPLIVMSIGMGLAFVSVTIAATNGVPNKDSGLASGILNTTQQIGGALGLAILSAVAASKTTDLLKEGSQDVINATIQGYHSAFYVGAGLALISSVVALTLVHQKKGEKIELKMPA